MDACPQLHRATDRRSKSEQQVLFEPTTALPLTMEDISFRICLATLYNGLVRSPFAMRVHHHLTVTAVELQKLQILHHRRYGHGGLHLLCTQPCRIWNVMHVSQRPETCPTSFANIWCGQGIFGADTEQLLPAQPVLSLVTFPMPE